MDDDDPKWIELCARHQAWSRALTDYISKGNMSENAKWKRCIKLKDMKQMDDASWTDVIAAFPAP